MNAGSELAFVLDQILDRERLVGKAHVHDAGRVAFSRGEVDETAFAEDDDAPAVAEFVFFNKRSQLLRRRRHLAQGNQVELEIEMAAITDDRAVLHLGKMIS